MTLNFYTLNVFEDCSRVTTHVVSSCLSGRWGSGGATLLRCGSSRCDAACYQPSVIRILFARSYCKHKSSLPHAPSPPPASLCCFTRRSDIRVVRWDATRWYAKLEDLTNKCCLRRVQLQLAQHCRDIEPQ